MGVPGVVQPKDFHTSVSADNLPGQGDDPGQMYLLMPGREETKRLPGSRRDRRGIYTTAFLIPREIAAP